jgi:hypothetical protein
MAGDDGGRTRQQRALRGCGHAARFTLAKLRARDSARGNDGGA